MFEYALFKQLEKHYPANVIRGYIPNHPTKKYNLADYCLEEAFGIHIKECTWKTVAKLSDLYPEEGPVHIILRPLSKFINV